MAKRKRSKFGVDQTDSGKKERSSKDYFTGETILFSSKLEKQYYEEVVIEGIKDGTISKYKLQQTYKLTPSFKYQNRTIREITYVSDFDIWYSDGRFQVVDSKGRATADAKIKKKLMHYYYPDIDFIWVSYTEKTGWMEYSELEMIRRQNKKAKKQLKDGK
jgi:hypothetical protein